MWQALWPAEYNFTGSQNSYVPGKLATSTPPHGRSHTMELRLQLDAATPAPMGIVSIKGAVLNPAPFGGSRSWCRWREFDWECDKEAGKSYFTLFASHRCPFFYNGTIPSVQLLRSWPPGKSWLMSLFSTLDGLVWRHLTNAPAFSASRLPGVPDKL